MTIALAVLGILVLVGALVRARARRTVYVPMRMSEAWRRAHAGDPVPDHLR